MNVDKEIIENCIIDWRKRDIPKDKRAKLVADYMKEFKVNQAELSKLTGIHVSTIHNWLKPDRSKKRTDTEFKLSAVLVSLKEINEIEPKLESKIKLIEKELTRLKEIIRRKEINHG